MNRRNSLIVTAIAVLALGTVFVLRQMQKRRELEREALRIASEQLKKTLSNTMTAVDLGAHLDCLAKLDGDATTVTFTVSNRSSNTYRDMILQGFTLGKTEPREKATLPVRIAELAPGASHKFALHYDRLVWIGDDIPVSRIDMGWAEKPLDFSNSWVTVVNTKSLASDPSITSSATHLEGSSSTTGVQVPLDEEDARAIKSRRDALWKAKAAKTESQRSPPP
jgi:hypothetical protein